MFLKHISTQTKYTSPDKKLVLFPIGVKKLIQIDKTLKYRLKVYQGHHS